MIAAIFSRRFLRYTPRILVFMMQDRMLSFSCWLTCIKYFLNRPLMISLATSSTASGERSFSSTTSNSSSSSSSSIKSYFFSVFFEPPSILGLD